MALFPRLIHGKHHALSRTDGENISLALSDDGVIWTDAGRVHGPTEPWEIVQTGNCGSPLETAHGWVALIHGVGPMRTYSLRCPAAGPGRSDQSIEANCAAPAAAR